MIFCFEEDANVLQVMLAALDMAGFEAKGFNSANEMFSMLVEDLFAKELDINLHEIIDVYIKSFMTGYASKSLTTWNDDNLSYGYSYLLGAFVTRNYGDGIEVVKEAINNAKQNAKKNDIKNVEFKDQVVRILIDGWL